MLHTSVSNGKLLKAIMKFVSSTHLWHSFLLLYLSQTGAMKAFFHFRKTDMTTSLDWMVDEVRWWDPIMQLPLNCGLWNMSSVLLIKILFLSLQILLNQCFKDLCVAISCSELIVVPGSKKSIWIISAAPH